MTKFITHGLAFKSILASLLYFFSASVWAGAPAAKITYGPAASPVPTLSGMMLIVLALLLATIAFRILRQKDNHAGRVMVLSLLAVGTLASGLGGVKLIDDVYASPTQKTLTNPNGGTLNLSDPADYEVLNFTGGTTTILDIETPAESCEIVGPGDNPECIVGLEIADADSCFISVECD